MVGPLLSSGPTPIEDIEKFFLEREKREKARERRTATGFSDFDEEEDEEDEQPEDRPRHHITSIWGQWVAGPGYVEREPYRAFFV